MCFDMLKSALTVKRTLSTGEKIVVGKLVENSKQSFFQFDEAYIGAHSTSLAPFNLKADTSYKLRLAGRITAFMGYLEIVSLMVGAFISWIVYLDRTIITPRKLPP